MTQEQVTSYIQIALNYVLEANSLTGSIHSSRCREYDHCFLCKNFLIDFITLLKRDLANPDFTELNISLGCIQFFENKLGVILDNEMKNQIIES